ncbi:hypothetical protein [Cytobacillus dafuensis]|uniref:Helix-turn-helix domain-containing protein n=1 Tax=Cytobacillus dafuensis TaxID=1742359 RepID=A0A5B8Z4Q6_CYTDA|nr:hypothetical protein [Cytobacillus dafuensis]QED48045.1 hypothetical protein FSZ17_12780 [Cytobacillus dafuensis]
MNFKSGSIKNFTSLSQFQDLKEFNSHMEMWLAKCKHHFSKGELVALKRLVRFSAKIPGVCNAKIGTMLKAIHQEYNGNGISRSTFKRMIMKASTQGILTVHETERKNGSQSSNLYVFNRFPKSEPPKKEKMNHPIKTSNLSKTNIKKNNKRSETDLDYTFTSDQVPQSFVNVVKCFFSEAVTIEEFWRMAKIAAYRNNRENETEQILSISIQSFKQLIRKMKSNRQINKPIAYYYGILERKFEGLYFEELYELGFVGNVL